MSDSEIHLCWTLDCEVTQREIDNIDLGRRAIRGFVDLISAAGMRSTLFVLPADAQAYPDLLRQLVGEGVEIGLHYHAQEEGYNNHCGAFTAEQQFQMYSNAIRQFSEAAEFNPSTFRVGFGSANDAIFQVTADLGFDSCSHSMPGRNIPAFCSNWVGAPSHVHYAHPANRLLEGGLDLVEVPLTTDPDSLLWAGGPTADLRVELFDAKTQKLLIEKALIREKAKDRAVKAIVGLSHNVFDYADPEEFRRLTLQVMLNDFVAMANKHEISLRPSTISEVGDAYRRAMGSQRKSTH